MDFPFPAAKARLWAVFGVLLWVVAMAGGFATLLVYSVQPGTEHSPPSSWPVSSALGRSTVLPTLVVFAHPRCPCTTATLEELARILRISGNQMKAQVVFLQPGQPDSEWNSHSALWKKAAGISGLGIVQDPLGTEARKFGAATSGRTFLYSPDGRLLFSGGITPSRGEAGENPGSEAILALVLNSSGPRPFTPVFGCPLFASTLSSP